jgi:hypothetical protein
MKFVHSSLVKQSALDVVKAEDRHLICDDAESAARLGAAHAKLRRILTEQIAYVMKTPTPQRAALVTEACAHFVRLGREYADRRAVKN